MATGRRSRPMNSARCSDSICHQPTICSCATRVLGMMCAHLDTTRSDEEHLESCVVLSDVTAERKC